MTSIGSAASDAAYQAAQAHPFAGPILEALHQQDANTYHGNSGDIAALAMATAAVIEPLIRADERKRLADLLADHRDVIAHFPTDAKACVDLIVLLLGLSHD